MLLKEGTNLSEGIKITEGVLRSEVLIPLLLSLFLTVLKEFLISKGVSRIKTRLFIRLILLGYADDLILFAMTWKDMEFLLECLLEYRQLNLLTLNANKTNVVIFRKGGRPYKLQHFNYGQEQIRIVPRYNYLGINVYSAGLFNHVAATASTRSLSLNSKKNFLEVIGRL